MYRALIVDDEPVIQKGLEKLIGQVDPAITRMDTAANGLEAMEKIAAHRPDFLFTDIRMPKMDGLQLCQWVFDTHRDIQMVVISGFGDFHYAQKCMSFGVKEYLLKPVNKAGVNETVRKLIANERARQTISLSGRQGDTRHQAYIPISALEEWLDNLEDAVWHLDAGRVDAIIVAIRQYSYSIGVEHGQLHELARELVHKLIKQLNRRDVYTFELPCYYTAAAKESPAAGKENDLCRDWTNKEVDSCWDWMNKEVDCLIQRIRSLRKGNPKEPVEEAKAYIELNLNRELTLEEVADKLGLNPSYFSQLFKQMTDETFVQYRTKRRMEKSKKLLAIPHYKITDISFEVGYADHPHFTKTFKKYTGCTPSEYRERLGMS
ncbi:response regulator [Paenibacillus senegalensis]|uniref:response regulator n=1 Tax=Paenibacillus senegalensis TaxID=1465766 RepID=UPI00028A3F79|nr:response regulator [Paenibacillus senegalensis]